MEYGGWATDEQEGDGDMADQQQGDEGVKGQDRTSPPNEMEDEPSRHEREQDKAPSDKTPWWRDPPGIQAAAAVTTAVWTGLYVFVAAMQWGVMQGTLEETKASNIATRTVLEVQNRAWLVVQVVQQMKLTAGENAVLKVVWENVGHIPATNVVSRASFEIVPKGTPFKPHYRELSEPPSKTVVGPGKDITSYGEGLPPPDDIWDRIGSGEMLLRVFGKSTYDDVLAQGRETTFCMAWEPKAMSYSLCDTYNESP